MKNTMMIAFVGMATALVAVHADDQKMAGQMAVCGSLSADEQAFAKQLSSANQNMFCSKFSSAQRTTAMQMTGKADASGNMMTADQSVQKVAMDNNMMPAQAKAQGGCPVK